MKKFNQNLNTLFAISGLDCEDLAEHLGIAKSTVQSWANGTATPDIYQFREIAKFFGFPYEWFLDDEDSFSNTEELAAQLGLSKETVSDLQVLAKTEPVDVMIALDDAVCALIGAITATKGK